ncbi:putative salicylate hydroxylase [Rosellinia necatrix]|uniref:Putative salicylate hydroxylase n=1 Tax=Rosellinia necatrix TaxID=77044 RepID=A0A1W2TF53_ROSNE|nr:putative salicylate hydroxylase [Rosellinia necatrix]
MSGSPSTIRVAIIGGGIASAALLRGLLRHSHIAADIYESQPSFKAEGHTISLTSAAEEILLKLDPSLDDCLSRAEAVYTATDTRIASGPYAGQLVDSPSVQDYKERMVDPQRLLDELLRGTPPRMIHANSRIASITEISPGGGVMLTFVGGTQKKYDIVVGSDGVHGITREFVLGPDDPALRPQHTGVWRIPIKVPYKKALNAMGPEFLDPHRPCQTSWIGDGTYLQHDFMGAGKDVHITAYAIDSEYSPDSSWASLLTPEEFGAVFASIPLPVCRGMVNLIQSLYTVQIAGISYMQHKPARTYVTKNAALIDDAAHSVLAVRGVNALVGLEEAYILSMLLGQLSSKAAIPAALQAFDHVCRPRAEEAVRHTIQCGLVTIGRDQEVGLDPYLMGPRLQYHWQVLKESKIEAQQADSLQLMSQLLAQQ